MSSVSSSIIFFSKYANSTFVKQKKCLFVTTHYAHAIFGPKNICKQRAIRGYAELKFYKKDNPEFLCYFSCHLHKEAHFQYFSNFGIRKVAAKGMISFLKNSCL